MLGRLDCRYLYVPNSSHVHPGLRLVRLELHCQLVALEQKQEQTRRGRIYKMEL